MLYPISNMALTLCFSNLTTHNTTLRNFPCCKSYVWVYSYTYKREHCKWHTTLEMAYFHVDTNYVALRLWQKSCDCIELIELLICGRLLTSRQFNPTFDQPNSTYPASTFANPLPLLERCLCFEGYMWPLMKTLL